MNRIEKARELRKQIDANMNATRKMVRVDELTVDELSEMINLYPSYETGKAYITGDVFRHEGRLYKIIQDHTSQADWLPSENPALYVNLMPDNVIPEWVQPAGSHDSYGIGDKVIFEGKIYESTIDSNTWSPIDYPIGWLEINN